jgi:hypothetical protein
MLGPIRARLTFANVMAAVAVFFALGGSAVAVKALKKNSVRSKQIANNSIKNVDVRGNALQGNKINESTLKGVEAGNISSIQVRSGATCTAGLPLPAGVTLEDGTQGTCTVHFPSSVFGCSIFTSPDNRHVGEDAEILVPQTTQDYRDDDAPNTVFVYRYSNGSLADIGFSMLVVC